VSSSWSPAHRVVTGLLDPVGLLSPNTPRSALGTCWMRCLPDGAACAVPAREGECDLVVLQHVSVTEW